MRWLYGNKKRYTVSVFCFIAILILAVCTLCEKPEFDKIPNPGRGSADTISSTERGISDFVTSEFGRYSALKHIISGKNETGRYAGGRALSACALYTGLVILACVSGTFLLHFFRDLVTSHRFIISYIHNLDGMKP